MACEWQGLVLHVEPAGFTFQHVSRGRLHRVQRVRAAYLSAAAANFQWLIDFVRKSRLD